MEPCDLIRQIEAAAKTSGIAINDLCQQIPVNRATWQRWKAGKYSPDINSLRRAGNIVGIEIIGVERAA